MVMWMTVKLEVEQQHDTFASSVPAEVQLVYDRGKWRAQANDPPIATFMCDSLEEALIAAGKEIQADLARQKTAARPPAAAAPTAPTATEPASNAALADTTLVASVS